MSEMRMGLGAVWLRSVALFLLVIVAATTTMAAVLHAQHRAQTVANMEKLQASMYALSAMEWRAVTEEGVSQELAAEMQEQRGQLLAELSEVLRNRPEPGVRVVAAEADEYLAAYDAMIGALAGGDLDAAEEIDEERVDPTFEGLQQSAEASSESAAASSDQAARLALAVVGVMIPVGAVSVWSMSRRAARRRTAQKLAEAERASVRRFESMVRGASDMVLMTDVEGRVAYASPATLSALGVEPEDLVGVDLTRRVHHADQASLRSGLRVLTDSPDGVATVEFRAEHTDGSWRVLEARLHTALDDPAVAGVVWNARDVTDRRALESQLAHQAFHDVLTGLANRALLLDRLGQALLNAEHSGSSVAAVVIDLDGFKDVNDSLGHAAGDQVITTAASRLQSAVRPGDTVARLGGDEFVLLLPDVTDPEDALSLAAAALEALARPIPLAGRQLRLSASAGVVTTGGPHTEEHDRSHTSEGHAAEALLRDADVAMYAAKERGKNQASLFEESMRAVVQDRLDLSTDIRAATADGQIHVVYQPLIDLATGAIAGFEALARWHHPTRGSIPPVTFIPLAEETGAILDIGRRVLQDACAQVAGWSLHRGADEPPLKISVNLSGRQLINDAIVGDVRDALTETGLAPHQLVLEITESAVIEDLPAASRRLRDLRALGVRIAMDDFGTGYSSLSYLRRLPIDILKIDKSFLDDRAGRGPELLAGVAALGSTLGLLTIAEGIEGSDQLDQVRDAGCHYGQGYHFARPLQADAAAELLRPADVNAAAG